MGPSSKSGNIEEQQGQRKGDAVPAGPDLAGVLVPGLLHAWLGTRSSGLAEPCYESSLLCLLILESKGHLVSVERQPGQESNLWS